jgi:hypothetical protein
MHLTLPLVSLALSVASSALASVGSEQRMVQMGASQRRALEARNLALSQLSPNVRAELEKRDPSEYTLHYEHLLARDDDDDEEESELEEVVDELFEGELPSLGKRGAQKFDAGGPAHDGAATWVNGHGPGIGRCANGKAAITVSLDRSGKQGGPHSVLHLLLDPFLTPAHSSMTDRTTGTPRSRRCSTTTR